MVSLDVVGMIDDYVGEASDDASDDIDDVSDNDGEDVGVAP